MLYGVFHSEYSILTILTFLLLQAQTALGRIKRRLEGDSSMKGLPLSVEGQVHQQIQVCLCVYLGDFDFQLSITLLLVPSAWKNCMGTHYNTHRKSWLCMICLWSDSTNCNSMGPS